MKDTFKVQQSDTDVFESSCKEGSMTFKLLTADKESYEYEIEYTYSGQLYFLGFMVGIRVAQQITNKHLS